MPNVQYYVVRQDGAEECLVPMIPIDQLPDWLDIVGVPRELKTDEAVTMTGLLDIGRKGGAGGTFQVRVLTDGPGDVPSEPDVGAEHTPQALKEDGASVSTVSPVPTPSPSTTSADSVAVAEIGNTPTPSATGVADDEACAGEQDTKQHTTANDSGPGCWKPPHKADKAGKADKPVDAKTMAIIAYGNRVHGPAKTASTLAARRQSAIPNVLPCRYWCKTGRWCRFAHVMPLTSEGLALVDLTAPPSWYTKKLSEQDTGKKKTAPALSQGNGPTARSKAPYTGKNDGVSRDTTGSLPSPSKTHEPKTEDLAAAATATVAEVAEIADVSDVSDVADVADAEMEDLIDFT